MHTWYTYVLCIFLHIFILMHVYMIIYVIICACLNILNVDRNLPASLYIYLFLLMQVFKTFYDCNICNWGLELKCQLKIVCCTLLVTSLHCPILQLYIFLSWFVEYNWWLNITLDNLLWLKQSKYFSYICHQYLYYYLFNWLE